MPAESTDDNPPGGGYNHHPLADDHDGWRWHIRKRNDFQLELNTDNSVLRAVDFNAKAVRKGGDITGLMSFHFPVKSDASRGSAIIPGFYPVMHTEEDLRHKELLEFFHHKNKFRSNTEIPVVKFNLKFEVVHDIVTDKETFCATILLVQKWQISRLDVADFLACGDRMGWKPLSFDPPSFEVANLAPTQGSVGGRTSPGMALDYQDERIHLVIEDDFTVVAVRPTRITGYYFNEYQLNNYPFDSQILDVKLRTKRMPQNMCSYSRADTNARDAKPRVRDTEWKHESEHAYQTFEPDKILADYEDGKKIKKKKQVHIKSGASLRRPRMSTAMAAATRVGKSPGEPGRFCLTVMATFQRHYSVHLFRVGFVMALFSLAAVTTMMPHCDSSMERITLLVTLMLTATTYSLVVAESLPTLPYLTIIDKYVLGTFAYFGIIGLELAIIDWADEFEWANENDPTNGTTRFTFFSGADGASSYHATFVNLVLWALFHVIMGIYVWLSVATSKKEAGKKMNPHQREVAKIALQSIYGQGKTKRNDANTEFEERTTKLIGLTWRNKAMRSARNRVGVLVSNIESIALVPNDEPGVLEQNKSRPNSAASQVKANDEAAATSTEELGNAIDSMLDSMNNAASQVKANDEAAATSTEELGKAIDSMLDTMK